MGWKFLVKVLEDNITFTESKLFGNRDMEKGDTTESLQNQRNDRVELKNLPATLIEIQKIKEVQDINLDPYD